ncbi:uncharacterized protein LOC117190418 [Drosophila miranda]|uniref:uncharacterized protein LOC117190418 n=1 Tax=Drosophila miranda TaxID=7229 RepID=UPI00143F5016|nr:uncharacterized protein LOC117190418 [Drosophila miranda]
MNIRWIASRRKDELQSLAKEFGLGETGTVEDLRSRITAFIARPGHPEAVQASLDELATHFGNTPSPRDHRSPATSPGPESRTKMEDSKEGPKLRLIVPELPSTSQGSTHGYRESATETPAAQDEQPQRAAQGPLQGTRPEASSKNHEPVPTSAGPLATPSHQTTTEGEQPRLPQAHRVSRPGGGEISYSLLADKLRKWGFTFDGHADPLAFIERLEERVESYGGSPEQLPRAISGLLTGKAEGWFRTFQMQGQNWTDFRKEFLEFFLPPRYFQRLEDTIRSREQKPKESFRD